MKIFNKFLQNQIHIKPVLFDKPDPVTPALRVDLTLSSLLGHKEIQQIHLKNAVCDRHLSVFLCQESKHQPHADRLLIRTERDLQPLIDDIFQHNA